MTTLSVNALAAAGDLGVLDRQDDLRDWLLRQQGKERHPYTGAEPGGWGWTDLPGSVPDADDTAGAMLALNNVGYPAPPPAERKLRFRPPAPAGGKGRGRGEAGNGRVERA